jgi:dTDP-4-amino-4,6-dideoxygalactose transaminase
MTQIAEKTTTTTPLAVPLVDLRIQTDRVAAGVREALDQVMSTTSFVLGPQVDRFEKEYADFCSVDHCIGVGNGTDAIELALRAAGVGAGDEVVIPANTFVATAEAVARSGAQVVLADCGDDFLLDPASLAERATRRTRAVIGVDLYGQVADFASIRGAVGRDVLLFEDAAQSQGASRDGQMAGSFGTAASTSFYPGKNLGAFGDAGAVMTSDAEVAERTRMLRNHGGIRRYEHLEVGVNSRLDSLQAAILSLKLRELEQWNEERRSAARLYGELLDGLPDVVLPTAADRNVHVWHLYVVRVPERDRVLAELAAAGIHAGIHYPAPVHLLPAFTHLGRPGSFPVAEGMAGEILSLPIFPGITFQQQERVAEVLTRAVAGSAR